MGITFRLGAAIAVAAGSFPLVATAQQWFVTNPGQRQDSAVAFDSERARMVLFGGASSLFSEYGNDTWEWDGSVWNRRATSGPSQRALHALAYDSLRRVTVMFGGIPYNGSYFGDTWEWNGSTWTLRATSGPNPRARHAIAYDSDRHVVVLFGGFSQSNGNLNDTWEWDGTNWALRSVSGPVRRCLHAMAYDSSRHVTVMFGGSSQSSQYSADLWEWNGVAWTQRQETGPVGRNSHSMAYDSDRAVTLVFGGTGTNDALLWEWNGTAWTSRDPAFGLHQMASGGLVYDNARKVAAWYGGVTPSGGTGNSDVWMFGSPCTTGQWQRQPSSASARPGSTVVFSAETSAYPAPTYRWRRNGLILTDGPTGTGSTITGALTATLQVSNSSAADAGAFDCVATTSCGTIISDAANLSVCPADFDSNGFLNGADFDDFVHAFEEGC